MATINLGGRELPAAAVAAAIPLLAALYVAEVGYFGMALTTPEETTYGQYEACNTKDSEIAAKQEEAAQLKEQTKEMDRVKAETEALEKSIELLRSKIPSEAQIPVLLYDLERMALASQGNLNSFAPGELRSFGGGAGAAPAPAPTPAPTPKPGGNTAPAAEEGGAAGGAAVTDILELPVSIVAEATYPQVIKFLDQLGTYERKLNVTNLSLTPVQVQRPTGADAKEPFVFKNALKVEFTLSAYVLRRAGAMQP